MHPLEYKEIEKILYKVNIKGKVLEVGALPKELSLLNSKYLKSASEKIGLNLDGPFDCKDFKILKGNANNMKIFNDEYFDCVICNSVLEHDKYFWKSISEMKRVLKKGGVLILGAPSYVERKLFKKKLLNKLVNGLLNKITKIISRKNSVNFNNSTFCFKLHEYPGDFYRYSEQTFKEVFFEGFRDVEIETIMIPPRTYGFGYK